MHSIAWWPTVVVVAIATVTDLRSRRIPNWLVFPFLVLGVGASSWQHGWHGAGQSAAGIGLGLLIYGFLFWVGGMGAGDVKLCAAIGAWIGPEQLFIALIFTALAGGVMALAWAMWGGFMGDLLRGTGDLAGKLIPGQSKRETVAAEQAGLAADEISQPAKGNILKRKMPYAPAIAIGTLMSFFAH